MNGQHAVQMAAMFAIAGHEAVGQVRKYTGEPYWHHCREVANMVWERTGDVYATQAAWMHDLLEDTQIKRLTIADRFGPKVAQLVGEVTDVSKPEDGNRAARKKLDREHLADASPLGKTIKLADMISNTRSIVAHDPDFAKVYLAEKRLLLPLLTGGDTDLYLRAEELTL
jgi:(p)ppGpp synthase/HD superfamily hydrolase